MDDEDADRRQRDLSPRPVKGALEAVTAFHAKRYLSVAWPVRRSEIQYVARFVSRYDARVVEGVRLAV